MRQFYELVSFLTDLAFGKRHYTKSKISRFENFNFSIQRISSMIGGNVDHHFVAIVNIGVVTMVLVQVPKLLLQ